MTITNYEKLGAFYLGREIDPISGEQQQSTVLYDAKDLTTHGLIIGMTGSGKTGLAVALIEEAIIDGIPVLAIDPKGDLGNLFLSFPRLQASDFSPWVDPVSASHQGTTPEEFAEATAQQWQQGLAHWGQDGSRIQDYIDAADRQLYTPGSRSGRPLSLLSMLSLPKQAILNDDEALRDRIEAAVSGLLALLDVEADPLTSPEHILLSLLFERSWRQGTSLDLAALIMQMQNPPVQRVGILELDAFFPAKDRTAFAIRLNGLLASPGFDAWMEGDPLDAGALLYNNEGKPRLSVVSISHLNDNERMFVVTCLLNSLINWMRSQAGSGSLRALVYMDEIYGYLPPVANPPSKQPLLTLLKQARAFGVGLTLATQNPVDLDYKALSNAGTWFLGRLQTERDKQRVIDGLEGAGGGRFNRAELEALLGRLESRQFLLHNVHEDRPVLFATRWVLNFLAGPLTRQQIKRLNSDLCSQLLPSSANQSNHSGVVTHQPVAISQQSHRQSGHHNRQKNKTSSIQAKAGDLLAADLVIKPNIHANLEQAYSVLNRQLSAHESIIYRPYLLAIVNVHYANQRLKVDDWERLCWLTELTDQSQPWRDADEVQMPEYSAQPVEPRQYAGVPRAARSASAFKRWQSQLKTVLYRDRKLERFVCKDPKAVSEQEETLAEFKTRLLNLKREQRDIQIEKLRKKYTPKLRRIQDQIFSTEQRLEKEQQQVQDRQLDAGLSFGATLVGALFGRKLASATNVNRASRAVRGARRIAREKQDVVQVQEKLLTQRKRLADLEQDFATDLQDLQRPLRHDELIIETKTVSCRKTDTDIEEMKLLWVPFIVDQDHSEPALAATIYSKHT